MLLSTFRFRFWVSRRPKGHCPQPFLSLVGIPCTPTRRTVPIQYAHQRLTLSANPFRVCLFAGSELVADHPAAAQKVVCGALGLGLAPRGSARHL